MKRLICLLPLFCLLCGCYPYTEIENMDIFTSLYADGTADKFVLGGGVANVRSFSDSMAENPVSLLRAEGASLQEAAQHLRQSADHELFYGALRAVVLGEGLTEHGILPLLRFLDAQPRLRRSTAIFTTDADMESIVRYKAINDFSGGFAADSILSTLDALGELRYTGIGDVLYALTYENAGHCIPHISMRDGVMCLDGYTLFLGDKAVGFTDNPAVSCFLCKNATVPQLFGGVPLTAKLKSRTVTPTVRDGVLTVDADFTFALLQNKDADTLKSERLQEAKTQITQALQTELEAALADVQATGCDYLGLYQYRLTQGRSDFDMQQWNAMLKTMRFRVRVEFV